MKNNQVLFSFSSKLNAFQMDAWIELNEQIACLAMKKKTKRMRKLLRGRWFTNDDLVWCFLRAVALFVPPDELHSREVAYRYLRAVCRRMIRHHEYMFPAGFRKVPWTYRLQMHNVVMWVRKRERNMKWAMRYEIIAGRLARYYVQAWRNFLKYIDTHINDYENHIHDLEIFFQRYGEYVEDTTIIDISSQWSIIWFQIKDLFEDD